MFMRRGSAAGDEPTEGTPQMGLLGRVGIEEFGEVLAHLRKGAGQGSFRLYWAGEQICLRGRCRAAFGDGGEWAQPPMLTVTGVLPTRLVGPPHTA